MGSGVGAIEHGFASGKVDLKRKVFELSDLELDDTGWATEATGTSEVLADMAEIVFAPFCRTACRLRHCASSCFNGHSIAKECHVTIASVLPVWRRSEISFQDRFSCSRT